jgi:hypothetical protein
LNQTQRRTSLALAIILSVASFTGHAQGLSAQDRTKAVEYLNTTLNQVLTESEKLSDAQWNFKESPERWSVGEVVEHLALAETFLFDLQQKTMAGPPATPEQLAAAKGKDEVILKAIPDRTKKVSAPEPLQPTKRLGSRAEVIAAFKERRAKTIAYVSKTNDNLRGRVSDSALGPTDGYQWVLFVGAHTERHLAQLKQVKADARFPKS